jgi:hypothetical protein
MKYILKLLLISVFLFSFSQSAFAQVYVQSVYNPGQEQNYYTNSNPVGATVISAPAVNNLNYSGQKYPDLCSSLVRTLRPGSTGNDIRNLQLVLGQEGILYLDITGTMNKATQRAIKIYQKRNGLTQTGFVGPKTLSLMQEQWCSGGDGGLEIPTNPELYPNQYQTPRPYYPSIPVVPTFPSNPYLNPNSDISIIPSNTSLNNVTLTWDGKNSNSCTINNEQVQVVGSRIYTIYTATNYTFTCLDYQNRISSKTILVNPNTTSANLPTVTVSLNPQTAIVGQTATVSWTSQNATYCSSNFSNQSTSGSQQVTITSGQQTFTVTCYNSAGLNSSQTVYANGTANPVSTQVPTITSFSLSTYTINQGQFSTLTWTTSNANSCILYGGGDNYQNAIATSGSQQVSPSATLTYSISCTNNYGTSPRSNLTLYVNGTGTNIPTLTVSPSTYTINSGQTTPNFTISSTNVSICNLTGYANTNEFNFSAAATNGNGSFNLTPIQTKTYGVNCLGTNGQSVSQQVVVVVNGSNANPSPDCNGCTCEYKY